jgi:hypothetical protein
MPNIVITEGLDTPWELKDTESNITAATDLTSINLANQTVGTLAYTASQLFASLKTEKSNLDNIVDAIELINEEIALFPEKIAKWDTPFTGLSKVDPTLFPSPFGTIFPIATAKDMNDNDLSNATILTTGPGGFSLSEAAIATNRKIVDSAVQMIAAKPLLDAQNISYSRIGVALLFDDPQTPDAPALWTLSEVKRVIEATTSGTGGAAGDLIVYRDTNGNPISYGGFGSSDRVPASQVKLFYIPKDAAERDLMQAAVNGPALIEATNALVNTTGLPLGVTPPVTTLGLGVEKYYDTAKYTTVVPGYRPPFSPPPETIYGAYPPLLRADFDLTKLTKADSNKFFQRPGSNTIFYIADVSDTGVVDYRFVNAQEPFINKMTDDMKKALRGEYAEKQILLTQRSTDQTLFVTSITQRYTTFSDMATNLLKTLVNFYNDLARNLRG